MSISEHALKITRPRILELHRERPDRVTSGDWAIAQFEPGLAQFLSLQDSDGRSLGEGFAIEWIIPLSAASTAANAVSAEQGGWTGVSLSVDWTRAVRNGETVLGKAHIVSLNPSRFGRTSETVSFEATAKESGDLLTRGTMIYVTTSERAAARVGDEAVPASAHQINQEDTAGASHDLFYLERPAMLTRTSAREESLTVRDSWHWKFPAALFRLLANPIAGHDEPLGRGFHPYGYVSLGAVLHAASRILGPEFRPSRAELRWLRLVSGRHDFYLDCELQAITAEFVTLTGSFFEANIKVAQVCLTLSRA